jgi:hypothetical protein
MSLHGCSLRIDGTLFWRVVWMQAARRADELLRLLHGLCTYGWPISPAPTGAAKAAAAAASLHPAVTEGGGFINRSAPLPAKSGVAPGGAAVSRQWTALTSAPAAAPQEDVATSEDGSARLPAAALAASSSSRSVGKPAAAVTRMQVGGSSWYTDSDSDEDDEGLWRSGPRAGSISAEKPRRIPKRVRATALHCIQALAKQDARLVASRWSLFVPEVQGCHVAPFQPSVLTVMLFDPSMRVCGCGWCAHAELCIGPKVPLVDARLISSVFFRIRCAKLALRRSAPYSRLLQWTSGS